MPRVYACPIIGTGTGDDSYRAKVIDLLPAGTPTSACIATGADGIPTRNWTVVWVNAATYSAVDADTQCVRLDGAALDGLIPTAIQNKLIARGVATTDDLAGKTLRQLLRWLVQRHYPYADEVRALRVTLAGVQAL